MDELSQTPMARFMALVERRLGLHYDKEQWRELEPLLAERSARSGVEGYLQLLASGTPSQAEWKTLAERLTVGETYFLRHPTQLEVLVGQVLPGLVRQAAQVRVLCAGCSSGEEPYSIALMSRELGRVDASRLRVVGIDVNPRAVARARAACYSPWSLRSVPVAMRERWFERTPEGFALRSQVREQVTFEERNLLEDDPSFWAPGSFHVIVCRNVVLYFPQDVIRKLIARMTQALVPGGYLFLGPSETLRGISDDFELLRSGDAFYYRLRQPSVATLPRAPTPLIPPKAPAPTSVPISGNSISGAWEPVSTPTSTDGLEVILQLLDAERYTDAWTRLEALPDSSHPRAQLLRAVLHLHAGRLDEAERVGRHLVAEGSNEPAAQYLLGLCLEQAGDEKAARARYAAAVRADPTFALGHLRAGSLARRAGAVAEARVALRMSLSLLPQEKPFILSLFGGGFGRHGLIQLGLRELQACTEAP